MLVFLLKLMSLAMRRLVSSSRSEEQKELPRPLARQIVDFLNYEEDGIDGGNAESFARQIGP